MEENKKIQLLAVLSLVVSGICFFSDIRGLQGSFENSLIAGLMAFMFMYVGTMSLKRKFTSEHQTKAYEEESARLQAQDDFKRGRY